MDLKHIHSPEDVAKFVNWCRHAHVDMAFPCVNHVTGYMAYASDLAARSIETDRWDPTAETLKQCKGAGIETHVWVCIGNWGRYRIEPALISVRGPRPLQETHPEWFCTEHTGMSMLASHAEYACLNPAHPAVREFHVKLCDEILNRYEFDGYHLDYIRYHFHSHQNLAQPKEAYSGDERGLAVKLSGSERVSFDEETLRAFQSDTGIEILQAGPDLASRVKWLYASADGGSRRETWYAWKSAQVTRLAREIGTVTRRRSRLLSAAVFSSYPWCGQEVAQRWPEWVDERLLDFVVPMDYGIPFEAYPGHLKRQTDAMKIQPAPAIPMISGVYSKDIFDTLPPGEAAVKLRLYEAEARRQHRSGISLFSYESFRGLL